MHVAPVLQRCGDHSCPPGGCERTLHRKPDSGRVTPAVPASAHQALAGPGQPLETPLRQAMQARFGAHFGRVRVHTDGTAAASARDLRAAAYTVGEHIVFGAGRYRPVEPAGARVLAHELTHVLQQRAAGTVGAQPLVVNHPHGADEREADAAAEQVCGGGSTAPVVTPLGSLQRQAAEEQPEVPAAQIDGPAVEAPPPRSAGPGAMPGYVEPPTAPTMSAAVQVCARELSFTSLANHTYVHAPPYNYAVIGPLCRQHWYDTPLATSAQKWDNSPDPCGKKPTCLECVPLPGVTDVRRCLRDAFTAYAHPSEYKLLRGPNSNTFTGTLARSCCAGMVPKPAALGTCPGWDHPAAAVRGGEPCPPGPPEC